ncbi:aldose 1-epimerase family protein [Aurantimonas sp. HBX-1]|uniref:aldose 1-epimerase family protein n=1 Tax=Aurantimonas sp. HBX-1 TaxID=2906072 RepID=UPI001F482F90|nr:aldose 1-epimerase family protein [Aurantimonas sp. HBX-1]UIJ71039.1 aldose 1-epimerase family protein [Aurantimonas sp. HBX-1]
MSDTHEISAGGISAVISSHGAELVGLRDAEGTELLWQAGPEWPRHAPVLFPIVGKLAGDTLRHQGRDYPIGQHGFARDRRFDWIERTAERATLRLRDDAETRAAYPFPFTLDVTFAVAAKTLTVTSSVTNPGDAPLPCGVGAHPGFRWPLVDGVAKTDHVVEFDTPETGMALSVEGGLLGAAKPLPFDGRTLNLAEALFERDALVMPSVASRSVRFVARAGDGSDARVLTVAWEGYKDLGIWSKPGGAPFLCIEPWFSMASPVGWDGEFADKPGVLVLAPGATRDFAWSVQIDA